MPPQSPYGAPPGGSPYGQAPSPYGAPAQGQYGAPAPLGAGGASKTEKIVIPTVCAGTVIGKGGTIIGDIKTKSQTQITIADASPQVLTFLKSIAPSYHHTFFTTAITSENTPLCSTVKEHRSHLQLSLQQTFYSRQTSNFTNIEFYRHPSPIRRRPTTVW
jgi:hypothetical protein